MRQGGRIWGSWEKLLYHLRTLLKTCSTRMSRVRLALHLESATDDFHELTHSLPTLLGIFSLSELSLDDNTWDLVLLLHC